MEKREEQFQFFTDRMGWKLLPVMTEFRKRFHLTENGAYRIYQAFIKRGRRR